MEMKSKEHAPRLPSAPPPYTPREDPINRSVVVVPPTRNTYESSTMLQNASSVPIPPAAVNGNIVVPKAMSSIATPYVCPSCNHRIITRVEATVTVKQHLFAVLLCSLGMWPCVFIPYCMPSCRKADHFCPICGSYIGTYVG